MSTKAKPAADPTELLDALTAHALQHGGDNEVTKAVRDASSRFHGEPTADEATAAAQEEEANAIAEGIAANKAATEGDT